MAHIAPGTLTITIHVTHKRDKLCRLIELAESLHPHAFLNALAGEAGARSDTVTATWADDPTDLPP